MLKKNTKIIIKWIIFKQKGIYLIIVYLIFISIVKKMDVDDNGGRKISHDSKLFFRLVNLVHNQTLVVLTLMFLFGMIWFYSLS
jgi:hypothetical protein